jgi:ABC-2 type transport system ATP-binding protein
MSAAAVAEEPVKTHPKVGEVIVETRNLTKVYRDFWGRKKKVALNALDLQIKRGEIFGLLGPNGSGKTTTIKLLLGLLFPTNGEATVFGMPAADVRKNERIGYLPEESYLYRFLNAEETLDFYGRLFDMPGDVRRARAAELIRLVGLEQDRRRTLREYSKWSRTAGGRCASTRRACASGSASLKRSSTIRSSSFWTSRRPGSTRWAPSG